MAARPASGPGESGSATLRGGLWPKHQCSAKRQVDGVLGGRPVMACIKEQGDAGVVVP